MITSFIYIFKQENRQCICKLAVTALKNFKYEYFEIILVV